MRKKKLQYWFKSQLSNTFIDVTANVTKHIQGSEKINDLPGSFKFSLSPTKKNGQLRPIFDSNLDVNTGDIFLVTIDLVEIIAYGAVLDSGRDIVAFDYQLNQVIPKFDITCIQPNFSSTDIEKIEYLSAISFSTLLDNILSYANEDFGAAGIGKYKLNIDDFDVNSFSSENKDSRQMLTESCDQNNLFWVMKYILYTENSIPVKIERYVEISNKNGIIPSIDSTFYNGIDNNNARRGYTKDANNNFLSIDNNFKPRKDVSVIINKLSLVCKVPFYDDSSEKLYRYNRAALPNTFDYELDGYASEIKYIAFALQDPKFPVKCLSGSTSSSVKIPSRFAVNINVNDIAYFKDNNPDGFYKITSVTRVNDTYTTIGFSPSLPFTPSISDSFEIAGNVPIFTSEKDLDYSSHGALVDCNIKNNGKAKFLDLSEPPPGTFISFFYKRVKDFEFIVKNDDSIKNPAIGLRYKQIRIDDTVTFTKDELDNLSSKLLVLKPKFDFSFNTYRKGLAQIGLTMSVNIDNFVKESFILNEMSYSFMGNYDSDGYPLFDQNLTFSTEVSDPQKVLDRYIKIKQKASTTKESLEKNKQIEEVQLIENILWDFKRLGIDAPTALSPSGITSSRFYANWSNTIDPSLSYDTLDVSLFEDFRNFIDGYNNHSVGLKTTELVNGSEIAANDIFYYRVRSFNKNNIPSEPSNVITVNKNNKDFVTNSNNLYYYKYQNNTNDEKGNLNATISGSAIFSSGIITNDNYCLYYSNPSWLTTANDNSNYDNFTIRRAIYFETGNKASKSRHIFTSKYNTHDFGILNGVVWYLDFITSTNEIRFYISQSDGKYRLAKCTYNLLENTIYTIQAAFKKVDPNNSNLNTFEICVNGIKQSITFDQDVSNISNVLMTNMPIYTNAEIGITGNVYVGAYKDLRNAVDLEFRTETEALTDYNIISS